MRGRWPWVLALVCALSAVLLLNGRGAPPEAGLAPLAAGRPQQTWLEEMTVALRRLKVGRDGSIPTAAFLDVVDRIPPVYEALFSVKLVVGILQKDLTNSAGAVRKAAAAVPGKGGKTLHG